MQAYCVGREATVAQQAIVTLLESIGARARDGVKSHRVDSESSHDEQAEPAEWSEEDLVLLHWRLLLEVRRLSEADTPLEEKFDTLRWVFTEKDKDSRPFSFASCLRVVGCSPLSPIGYCGRMDVEEIRDLIRSNATGWLIDSIGRYPVWVREAIAGNPGWVEANLARDPQWINRQIKRSASDGDLFA